MLKKKLLSVLLAAAMTCAMCLSVGAAEVPADSSEVDVYHSAVEDSTTNFMFSIWIYFNIKHDIGVCHHADHKDFADNRGDQSYLGIYFRKRPQ